MTEHSVRVILDIPIIFEDRDDVTHAPLGRTQLGGDKDGQPTTFYFTPAEQARMVCDMAFQAGLEDIAAQAGIRIKVTVHHSAVQEPDADGSFPSLTIQPFEFPDVPPLPIDGPR